MTAQLAAIEFDKNAFPLSPHMQCFTVREEFRRIVVTGYGDVSMATSFNVPLEDDRPSLKDQPDGAYSLLVTAEGRDISPIIVFSLKDLRSGELEQINRMSFRQFISDFEMAYMERNDMLPDDIFETAWTAAYLQKRMGHAIEGNNAFWAKLHEELDMAIVPLQTRMIMQSQRSASKEMIIQTRDLNEYPKARLGT
jgi:hypothetical protein